MNNNKYYEILNLNKNNNLSEKDIKNAYKKAALKWHPDKCNKSEDDKSFAENKFKDVTEAYNILSNPEKKKIYDKFGEEGLKKNNQPTFYTHPHTFTRHSFTFPNHTNFKSNNFNEFRFENSNFIFSNKNIKKERIINVYVTLEELYYGTKKKVHINDKEIVNEVFDLNILPGWKEGTKITYNRNNSKIILILKEKPHPNFIRENNDIIWKCKLTNKQSLSNVYITIPLLDGTKHIISTENGNIYDKKKIIIKSKGMPIKKTNPQQWGNLIVEFNIIVDN
tara:strand:+ start:6784 stop:7623 length:840 start_codon:yes stop_codon:yes gene_type:complete